MRNSKKLSIIALTLIVLSALFFSKDSVVINKLPPAEGASKNDLKVLKPKGTTQSLIKSEASSSVVKETTPEHVNTKKFSRYLSGPKFLRPYYRLKQYVLKNKGQEKEFHDVINSVEMQSQSIDLLRKAPAEYDETQEKDRMMAISYLKKALSYADLANPVELRNNIAIFLSRHSQWLNHPDLRVKKSMAGDHIELFLSLHREDPGAANEVINGLQNSKLEKIYLYALTNQRNNEGKVQ